MIYVIATFNIKPGSQNDLATAAIDCIDSTRKEPGCIRYDLNVNVHNSHQITFVEEWKSREDLELHFKRPHMDVWREASAPFMLEGKVEIIHPERVETL